MKRPATPVTPETACEWLREQVAALDPCRNASPRDPQFKEWRQSTLTVVQRIWAGDTSRSRRFRRIPFRPPSTLADARQSREIFERGCAEASLLLKAWITEIEEKGVQVEVPEPHAETGIDQNAGNVELSASGPVNAKSARPERGRATERPKKSKKSGAKQPRLKDMLGFGDLAAAGGGRDAWKLPPSVDVPQAAESAPVDPLLVIEVVGLDDASDDVSTRQASWIEPPILEARRKNSSDLAGSPPASLPFVPNESVTPAPFGEMSSPDRLDIADLELTVVHEVEPAAFTPVHPAAPERPAEPVRASAPATSAAPATPASPPVTQFAAPSVAPAAASPAASTRPAAPAPPASLGPPSAAPPAATTSPGSTDAEGVAEIFALAAEVDRYDVPAHECDRVRGVLLDLAHSIGSGRNSWDALRAATVIVMHYPRLGRRAMPVLMPFLNRAA